MEPEDLTVIGHIGDLLVDIYTAKHGAYLHFTAVLNDGGKGAQSRRNDCSTAAVAVRNLARHIHTIEQPDCLQGLCFAIRIKEPKAKKNNYDQGQENARTNDF